MRDNEDVTGNAIPQRTRLERSLRVLMARLVATGGLCRHTGQGASCGRADVKVEEGPPGRIFHRYAAHP